MPYRLVTRHQCLQGQSNDRSTLKMQVLRYSHLLVNIQPSTEDLEFLNFAFVRNLEVKHMKLLIFL